MIAGQPIFILKEGTKRESGKDAMKENIEAAIAISNSVRSSLGPRGMDKMLVDSLGDIVITNDGVTILKEMDVEHPAAKMMVEVSKTQDSFVGDGTTTAVIIAGGLLQQAQGLINQNVHPTVISEGYRMASEEAKRVIDEISTKIGADEKALLLKMAQTSLNSKSASVAKDKLAEISYEAVKSVAELRDGKYYVDFDNIQVVKKQGGAIDDTQLINGIIVDKEKVHPGMPDVVKDAKIALLDAPLEIKKPEFDTNLRIEDPSMIQKFLAQEENMLREMVDKIKSVGANVVITQKGIDDMAQHYLSRAGIYAVRRVKKSDMDKLAKATGASIVSTIDEISSSDLGTAERVEQVKVGEDYMTFVTGCKNPKAVSILVRGETEHVVDEMERSITDSLHVVASALEDGAYAAGGGATAAEIAFRLRSYAQKIGGRQQLAIEKFADAIEEIPRALAENAGLDPIDILLKLRAEHAKGNKTYGINVFTGEIEDMVKNGVIEPIRVGKQAIESATEAAIMILRIDDVIATKSSSSSSNPPKSGSSSESSED
ncbi:thermosome beta chain [Thermoplasma acidophilum]|uniref:Thermosome subunit beta n=1 Tax=Thermoplasma acidophilum (strain ATCC 25905 / DSM 1728 / JCM 9062 / NBRC 15155 / AMRC-C165) TaxID=273075 RepID=THSB_THEAC|nr:thermosome subunit beta [Thermoplasma acidophilum]P48425.1 RecName: Full=Thermosome subunit beta; AltName: Full=Chaperonin subunit beta; AltName: Full=Thermosome subunit 2 [Thermoplasma acidophilum DSM 1728]1A6D_B Chain B, THERMOSOME (BETA SUBUNIT) [Thermoplasma acidophilum]1A6E_B Chain B, THERMOSOME (BETA SUBUNIT) [Thermoplasma acidophilum]CAA86611.1 thermosome beta-subunit [Thermoplasma acidophilum]CAC12400.1 thermosome beta chain [Thermoplasma acidophilum]